MISITCTNCRVALVIDDAFAGGVCRCQHCGTIQTVPSHLKPEPAQAVATSAAPAPKALYQSVGGKSRTSSDAHSGLEDLASAVATSSGLGSRRLNAPAPVGSPADAPARKRSPLLAIILGAAVVVIGLLAVIIFLLVRPNAGSTNSGQTPSSATSDDDGPARISGPNFCNMSLTDASTVFVVDRGSAAERLFDPVKAALFSAIESMGPNRKFAIVLTDNGSEEFDYPPKELGAAGAAAVDQLRSSLGDVMASGASHFRTALERGIALKPARIVFVTAKWTIDDEDAAALTDAAQKGIRIDTFALGDAPTSGALEEAAKHSGGEFHHLTEVELRRLGS